MGCYSAGAGLRLQGLGFLGTHLPPVWAVRLVCTVKGSVFRIQGSRCEDLGLGFAMPWLEHDT